MCIRFVLQSRFINEVVTVWSQHNRPHWLHRHFHLLHFFHSLTAIVGMWLLNDEVSWSHSDTHTRYDSSGCVIGPMQRPLIENIKHSHETDIHVPVVIRTHNPSKIMVADPRLRPRGHRDRLSLPLVFLNYRYTVSQMLQAEYSSTSFAFAISIGILTSCVTVGRHEILFATFINLNTLRTGHLNCFKHTFPGFNQCKSTFILVSWRIYKKFANCFCELKFSGNTHHRP
jgi:hypothetical protein